MNTRLISETEKKELADYVRFGAYPGCKSLPNDCIQALSRKMEEIVDNIDSICEKKENINSKIIDLVLQGKTLEEAKAKCGYNGSDGEIRNPICGVFFENYRKISFDLTRFEIGQELQKTETHKIFLCRDLANMYENCIIIGFHDYKRVVLDRVEI